MATLAELHTLHLRGDAPDGPIDTLYKKVTGAVLVAAEAIRNEVDTTANHVNRMTWAKHAFQNPEDKAKELWNALMAANASFSQAQILAANDAAIQSAVNNAINLFATP